MRSLFATLSEMVCALLTSNTGCAAPFPLPLGRKAKKPSARLSISSAVSGPACWDTRDIRYTSPAWTSPCARRRWAGMEARGKENCVTGGIVRASSDRVERNRPADTSSDNVYAGYESARRCRWTSLLDDRSEEHTSELQSPMYLV